MPSANVSFPPPLIRLTTLYPGQFGVPGTDSDRGLRLDSNGIILWVDPNHVDANDNRDGTNPDSPLATVAAAISKCRAYRGDTIVVMDNSFWQYGTTSVGRATPIREEVTINVPGIRLVGLAPGGLGVYWEPASNDGVCITVNVLDVTIEGFCFWNSTYTGGTGIHTQWSSNNSLYGENIVIRHCAFMEDLDYGITMDYSWYCTIEDCWFNDIGDTAIYNTSVHGDPDFCVVRDNVFNTCLVGIDFTTTTQALIEDNHFVACPTGIVLVSALGCVVQHNKLLTTMAGAVAISMAAALECIVDANVIQGDPAGVNNFIDATGGANNVVSGNYLGCSVAQYDTTCSDATSGEWVNNHCSTGDPVLPPI